MAPNETEDGFAQGPGVAEAPQGPELQVAGEGGNAVPAKVTLDLDDAPFMQKEESPEETPPKGANSSENGSAPAGAAGVEAPQKKSRKKLFIIAGAAVALLVILAAVYFLFLRGGDEPPPAPPPDPPKPEIVVVPSKPKVEVKPDVLKELEPFVVPHTDASGGAHFLYCKFSFVSKDPMLGQEVDSRLLPLRDAIFFYLKSKSTEYLTDAQNATTIKKELRGVVSDYLTRVKLEDVLLDSYLNE